MRPSNPRHDRKGHHPMTLDQWMRDNFGWSIYDWDDGDIEF